MWNEIKRASKECAAAVILCAVFLSALAAIISMCVYAGFYFQEAELRNQGRCDVTAWQAWFAMPCECDCKGEDDA